ncbi:hypothetical protein [Maridesulfovibrio sp.]|uniref:hypothetical protein n=1 Tax=Maridesulfovibrio sp. TaxID=2795000 RepID=UPI003BAA2507
MAENDYIYDAPSIDTTPGGDSVKSSILEKNQARVEQSLTLLNSHKNRTDSHGTTSPIVGVDDEQTLTNKTFVDPVITYSAEPAGTAPVTREWVENQGDLAVNQARTARDEAVQARDEAVAAKDIAVDAAKTLKITPEPVLVGDVSGNEGEDLVFTVTNHKAGVEYQASVTGGTVSAINGVITWALPSVEVDTDFILTVYASKLGFQQSSAVTKTVSVKNVPIQDGPTMIFADTTEGYPGAAVADGIVSAPAHSVGLNNTDQLVSAKPEIMVASGKLNLLEGTSKSVLKLAAKVTAGDVLITDQGECVIASVESNPTVGLLNTTDKHANISIANKVATSNAAGYKWGSMLPEFAGKKVYAELKSTGASLGSYYMGIGVCPADLDLTTAAYSQATAQGTDGVYFRVAVNPGTSTFMAAVDEAAGKGWLGLNSTWEGGGNPATGADPTFTFTPGTSLKFCYLLEGDGYVGTIKTNLVEATYVNPEGFVYLDQVNTTHTATLTQALPGVPTKAFKHPYKEPLTLKSATTTSITTAEKVTEGETLFVPERVTAGAVTGGMIDKWNVLAEVTPLTPSDSWYSMNIISNPNRSEMYAFRSFTADTTLYKSTDNAQTWDAVCVMPEPTRGNAAKLTNLGHLVCAGNPGVFVLLEGASSFTTLTADAGLGAAAYCMDCDDDYKNIYIGLSGGSIRYSNNSGSTFASSTQNVPTHCLCVFISSTGRVMGFSGYSAEEPMIYSDDKGAHWSTDTATGLTQVSELHQILEHHESGKLFAMAYTNIYVSTNDGDSWTMFYDSSVLTSNAYKAVMVGDYIFTGGSDSKLLKINVHTGAVETVALPSEGGLSYNMAYNGHTIVTSGLATFTTGYYTSRFEVGNYEVNISSANLSVPPTVAYKKSGVSLKVGAGATGEYLGPEKNLQLKKSKAIPVMTAATTGGFTMSQTGSGTVVSAPWAAWNASDGDPSTTWQRSDGTGDAGIEISGSFSDPVTRIDIQARSNTTATALKRLPKDFTVKGYNGSSWVTLKTVTGETGWQSEERRSFSFSNDTNYQKYWLNVSATEAGTVYREIGELALFYDSSLSTTAIVVESSDSIKDQIFTANGLHNNLLVDGKNVNATGASEAVVAYLKEIDFPGEIKGATPGSGFQSWHMNKSDRITGVSVINGIGLKSKDAMVSGDGYLGLFRENTDDGTLTLVKRVPLVHSGGEAFETVEFDAPYQADSNSGYIIGAANIASAKYINYTSNKARLSYSFSESSPVEGTTFTPNVVSDGNTPMFCYSTPANKFTTTINIPEQEQIPTSVAIPDRCTLAPASYTCDLNGDDLKVTGAEIALEDNPDLKRLAMAVSGDDLTFKGGKIYTKEKL